MSDNERNNSVYYDRILRIIPSFSMFFRHVILYDIIHVFTTNEQIFCRCIFTMMNKECALAYSGACGSRLRHHHCTPQCASCRMLFVYNRKCNFLLYKNVLVRYRTRTTYIVVPPYFTYSVCLFTLTQYYVSDYFIHQICSKATFQSSLSSFTPAKRSL